MKNDTKTRDELIGEISRIRSLIEDHLVPDDGKTDDQLRSELSLLRDLAEQLPETAPEKPLAKPAPAGGVESYRQIFEDSPLAFSENDMSKLQTFFSNIRHTGISDFRGYFEHHPEAVAKCAVLVKRTYANPATLRLYGAAGIEDFSDGLMSIFHEESYRVFREELIALAEGETTFEEETIVFTLQGERRDIYLKIMVVPGSEDTLSKVLVFVVDITDRKRAETMLAEMRETMARAGLKLYKKPVGADYL